MPRMSAANSRPRSSSATLPMKAAVPPHEATPAHVLAAEPPDCLVAAPMDEYTRPAWSSSTRSMVPLANPSEVMRSSGTGARTSTMACPTATTSTSRAWVIVTTLTGGSLETAGTRSHRGQVPPRGRCGAQPAAGAPEPWIGCRPGAGGSYGQQLGGAAGHEYRFARQDAADDGQRRRIGGVHAVVRQAAGTQGAGLRIRGVRGVVDDAEVDGQLGEVDGGAHREPAHIDDLVEGVAEGACLHLDHGERLTVVEVEVAAVLQKRGTHGHRPLVVQSRPEHQEGGHVVEAEGVVQPVGGSRVLVVDHVGDHHVAHGGIEGGRLAEDVDAAQIIDRLAHLAQDLVGAEPQRVVDVDHHRLALGQAASVDLSDARVDRRWIQPPQVDDLGRHPQGVAARHVDDAERPLAVAPGIPPPSVLGEGLAVEAGAVIDEVGPRALALTLQELVQLRPQVRGSPVLQPVDDLLFGKVDRAAQEVGYGMGVGRHEVDRPSLKRVLLQVVEDSLPPPTRDPGVTHVRPAVHLDADVELA